MTTEAPILQACRLRLSKLGCKMFRNVTGVAWHGDVYKLKDGSVLIRNPRTIHYGLVVGGSDLIGWTPTLITPEMVGREIAVFTAVETKRPNGGRRSDDQKAFIAAVLRGGGYAGFASSEDEAANIILKQSDPQGS